MNRTPKTRTPDGVHRKDGTPMLPLNARARTAGFTLVELLIVVIILAVLAAVVIPNFNGTSLASKEAALQANLQAMRQAIALYRVQHNEIYPGQAGWAEFVTQLTSKTNAAGAVGTGTYGPYLRTGIPDNPFTDSNDGKIAATLPAGPSGTEAYCYTPEIGEIRANNPGAGPSGSDYWDL